MGFLLHTVGPNWDESESESSSHALVCTYLNCFLYADTKLWLQSIALPMINAGEIWTKEHEECLHFIKMSCYPYKVF